MKTDTTQQNIPNGWKQVALGDLVSVTTGSRDANHGSPDGQYPFFTCAQKVSKIDEFSFDTEAVLIAGNGDFNVKYYSGKFDAYQRTYVLSDFQNTTGHFVYQKAKQALNDIMRNNQGSSVKFIKMGDLTDYEFILPPVEEQQKIAEILGMVDEDIAKTQEVIEATEKLKRGLMQGILSFGNKDEVKYLAFGDIGKVSMCKRIFKEETSDAGDIPFYKIGTFGGEPDSFISQEIYDKYRNKFSFPKIGDILLSASGTIGRKVIYDGKPAYFQDSNIIWLEHDESKILNSFLFHLYDTIKWQTEGSTIKRLYNDIFLRKIIPVPSIEKQKQIVEILSAIDEKIMVNRKLKKKLTLLKKGLMQDLLSGNVRTIIN